jgi:hypothetical protein
VRTVNAFSKKSQTRSKKTARPSFRQGNNRKSKGHERQKEKLKAVPDWQEHLREFVDKLISDREN